MNRHNCHYWTEEDPRIIAEKFQNRPKITVWCGMTSDKIVEPFISRDTINAQRYLIILQENIWPEVNTWENIEELIFMQDGVPRHFATVVREWLNEHFPGRWLARRGPHEWPARSPDLTPCDFFLWAWLKEQVYSTKSATLEELEGRLREVISVIPQEFLRRSIDAIPERLDKMQANGGGHIEF